MTIISYRTTESIEDMQHIVDLERVVWGMSDTDCMPIHVMRMCVHSGGAIFVAEVLNKTVGLCISFPAIHNNKRILWSHITGVHPNHQGKGIGKALKFKQREWAKENGFEAVGWTFDPLQSANANFNLNVLGAYVDQYHVNFYGDMQDELNKNGLPSDRLQAHWLLEDTSNAIDIGELLYLITADDGIPVLKTIPAEQPPIAIPLPNKQMLPIWQPLIRQAFQAAFSNNYRAVQFIRPTQGNPYYYLVQAAQLK